MFITPAYAQAAGQAAGGSAMLVQFFPLIAIFGIMYFLMIRPQNKRMKEHKEMVAALRRGDTVVTSGGILGKVTKVTDDDPMLTIEIADGVRVQVVRSTITEVKSKTEPVAKDQAVVTRAGDQKTEEKKADGA